MAAPTQKELFQALRKKAGLKQEVYHKTLQVFGEFKKAAEQLPPLFHTRNPNPKFPVLFEFRDRGQFEFEMKFGGDILIFMMHTNIFEFSRDHEVMRTPYVKEDPRRSYCGIIQIFNFLNDSFRYNRVNDAGYMIGRIFINRELHYFIEGKREIGLLYNNFHTARINRESMTGIIRSAMLYTVNFDLLTPDFNNVKEVTVAEMQDNINRMMIRTGKRLGYKFQADRANGEEEQ
jgi:hypothetical protein